MICQHCQNPHYPATTISRYERGPRVDLALCGYCATDLCLAGYYPIRQLRQPQPSTPTPRRQESRT